MSARGEGYQVTDSKQATTDFWNVVMGDIAARLVALERLQPVVAALIESTRENAVDQLNTALADYVTMIGGIAEIGAVQMAAATGAADTSLGEKTLMVVAADRQVVSGAGYVVARPAGDANVRIAGPITSYSAETGELHFQAIDSVGDAEAGQWIVAYARVGVPGSPGPAPAHEWAGSSLRWQNPDGSWGDWTDLLSSVSQAALGGKLDANGAAVKALYEGEDDTNALTDALLEKLEGVEDGATAGGGSDATDLGDVTGAVDLDWSTATVYRLRATGDVDLTFSGLPEGGGTRTLIINGAAGQVAWPADLIWDGVAPAIHRAGMNRIDITTPDGSMAMADAVAGRLILGDGDVFGYVPSFVGSGLTALPGDGSTLRFAHLRANDSGDYGIWHQQIDITGLSPLRRGFLTTGSDLSSRVIDTMDEFYAPYAHYDATNDQYITITDSKLGSTSYDGIQIIATDAATHARNWIKSIGRRASGKTVNARQAMLDGSHLYLLITTAVDTAQRPNIIKFDLATGAVAASAQVTLSSTAIYPVAIADIDATRLSVVVHDNVLVLNKADLSIAATTDARNNWTSFYDDGNSPMAVDATGTGWLALKNGVLVKTSPGGFEYWNRPVVGGDGADMNTNWANEGAALLHGKPVFWGVDDNADYDDRYTLAMGDPTTLDVHVAHFDALDGARLSAHGSTVGVTPVESGPNRLAVALQFYSGEKFLLGNLPTPDQAFDPIVIDGLGTWSKEPVAYAWSASADYTGANAHTTLTMAAIASADVTFDEWTDITADEWLDVADDGGLR